MNNQTNDIINPVLEQALTLFDRGWSVIPVGADKKPLVEWKKYQTERATREEVTGWFTKKSTVNLGIITGKISNLVVVDIDPRHGGRRDALIGYETVIVETGGGGWHYYFKYKEGIQNFAGIAEGIDIRGDGGYVIAPPSMHSSGNQYKWYHSPEKYEVLSLLPVVLGWINARAKQKSPTQSNWSSEKLDGVGEGQRNDTAASVAGKLLARFKPHEWESEAWKLLVAWNDKNTPPLPETELRTVFDSIAKREVQKQTSDNNENSEAIPDDLSLDVVLQKVDAVLPNKQDLVLLAMAVSISQFVDKKTPLWLMFVGVPSSAKTEVARMIGKAEWVFFLDALTENAFISGGRGDTDDLLPLLDETCLIIKDFTTTLSQREEAVRKILGDLTSIYDDSFVKHSPSRGTISYHSFFSILGCVTPQALNNHQRYVSQIGPRFLYYRVQASSREEVEQSFDILWSVGDVQPGFALAQKYVSAYVTKTVASLSKTSLQRENTDAVRYINTLARFIARARGIVITRSAEFVNEKGDKIQFYEPVEIQIEEPYRALQQLRVLGRSLCLILGHTSVGTRELQLLKDVAISSMPADRALLLSVVASENKLWSAKDVSDSLGISHRTALRQLDELVSLRVLRKQGQGVGLSNVYTVVEEFADFLYSGVDFLSRLLTSPTVTQTPQRAGNTQLALGGDKA